jgi:GWxTD domain-containing protein
MWLVPGPAGCGDSVIQNAIRAAWVLFCLMSLVWVPSALPMAAIAPRHQEWFNGPVSLLMTRLEREAFARLATDEDRDRFIERFWEIRNPKPGSPVNEFKDEFYSRLAYANAFYGRDAGTEGWRTDRGRAYILFGKPQTSMNFLANQELYPTEMWFYSNPGVPELPPFFYVVFFEKDGVSGYRLYNPVTDGPDKIMRAGPTKAQAYQYLRGVNSELAQATLTLIPGDMVDTESYSGSMASMVVLNAIRSYRDLPSYTRAIAERTASYEQVRSKVVYDLPVSTLQAFVAFDKGDPWLHWRLELHDPLQPKAKQGRVEFQILSQLYSKDELVYERTDTPAFGVPESQQEAVSKRPFVYEERFPVEPGEYKLLVKAVNTAAGRSYEAARPVVVEPPAARVLAGEILLADRSERDSRERPFQFGGTWFEPLTGGMVPASRPLTLLYQVKGIGNPPPALTAEYVIGSVAGKLRKSFEDKLELAGADSSGTVLVSKTLSLDELAPGAYIVALRLRNPQTGEVVGRSARFQVTNQEAERPIVVARPVLSGAQAAAAVHYERALCWLAQQRPEEAAREAEASWRLSQTSAARQLLDRLSPRAQSVPKN